MKLVLKRYTLPYRFISNFGSFVVITFGVFLGIELAKLLASSDKNRTIEISPELQNVTNVLQEKVRILCFVFTREREHKAVHVQQTWGKHCNKLLFISTSRTEDLDSILLKVNEGPLRLWPKTLATLDYLYENHLNEADWFLKADADSFVIIENLRYFLYSYFPEQALYFSYHLEKHVLDPGYVLSRGALRRYGEMTRKNKLLCPISPGNEEEYEDALICFSALKIRMSGAVDPSKCVTSFPSASCYSYETFINRKSKKFKVYMTESDCCPQQILSLSDVTPQTMHWLNYIIYRFLIQAHNARLFALLVFIIGLIMGIEIAKILCAPNKNQSLYMEVDIEPHIQANKLLKEIVSVLCWIPANTYQNKTESIEALQLTWANRCNKFVVLNKNPSLELSLQYIYDHYYNDAQWFLKTDPNNFVLVENLRLFLSKHDANKPAAFGHLVKLGQVESMGKDVLYDNLYVLSKGALNAIVKRGLRSKEFLESLKAAKTSSPLNYCLKTLGIPMGRKELDVDSCNKFVSRSHCYKIMPNATTAEDMDQSCCSPHAISFSSVQNNVMYFYDYLIYKMHIHDVK